MAYDAASPGFVVSVISVNPVLRIQGRNDPEALGQILDRVTDVTERVLGFTYEDSEKEHDILKLQVDNSDLYFLDNPAWVKGNLVRFFFGYPGRVFGPRLAVIDSFSGFLTLSITCTEQTSTANNVRCRVFKNLRRDEVVDALINDGAFPGVNTLIINRAKLAGEKKRDWTQARQTDWQFIQRLAEDVGYEVYIEGNILHFHPPLLQTRPVRRLEYFFGLGDLIDFDIKDWKVTDRPAETRVASRDPVSRQNLSATGSDQNTERPTLGNQNTLVINRDSETGGLSRNQNRRQPAGSTVSPSPERDQATVTSQADSSFRRQEENELEAQATIIGDPFLPAKSVVEITGLSGQLSGKYYVTKHIHEITRDGGYKGKLELKKNAVAAIPTSNPPTLSQDKAVENDAAVPQDRLLVIERDPVTGRLIQRRQ